MDFLFKLIKTEESIIGPDGDISQRANLGPKFMN
jgi:hypothetical protein